MVKIVLAFDDEDDHMGMFNRGCLEDYTEFLENYGHQFVTIQSKQLTDLNVQYKTNDDVPFIFAAYSHGLDTSLNSSSGAYVSTTMNQTCFRQAFFYTVSCHAANELGTCLIENGCTSFFGYKSPFNFWAGYKCFSHCANYGFFLFIQGAKTDEVYKQMLDEYNTQIDVLYEENSLIASLLLDNRKALVYKGENITIDSLSLN